MTGGSVSPPLLDPTHHWVHLNLFDVLWFVVFLCINFHFEIITNFQKSCNNNTRNSQVFFTQVHQLLHFASFTLIFSLYMYIFTYTSTKYFKVYFVSSPLQNNSTTTKYRKLNIDTTLLSNALPMFTFCQLLQ